MITLIHNSNWSFCLVFTLFIHSGKCSWLLGRILMPETMRRQQRRLVAHSTEMLKFMFQFMPHTCLPAHLLLSPGRFDAEHLSALGMEGGSICFINHSIVSSCSAAAAPTTASQSINFQLVLFNFMTGSNMFRPYGPIWDASSYR